MDKSGRYSGSKRKSVSLTDVETVSNRVPKSRKSSTVVVRTNYSGIVKVEGKVTHKEYVWNRYRDEVNVDEKDIGDWINKPMGHCSGCGGHSEKLTWFEIIGG